MPVRLFAPTCLGPYKASALLSSRPYALVYSAINADNQPRAVKLGRKTVIFEEYVFLSQMQGPQVVKIDIGSFSGYQGSLDWHMVELVERERSNFDKGYFAMELFPQERLLSMLLAHQLSLSLPYVVNQALKLAEVLLPFWHKGECHGDLTPNNIFDINMRGWVLFDPHIGAGIKAGLVKKEAFCGSSYYVPPEEQRDAMPHFSRDLFSLALVIYEAITRCNFFREHCLIHHINGRANIAAAMKAFNYNEVFSHLLISSALKQFLLRAMHPDPEKRIRDPDLFMRELARLI